MSILYVVLSMLAALVALGLVGFVVANAGYGEKLEPDGLLSAKEQAIVAAAADAYFPAGGPIPISGTEAGLVRYMDRYLERSPAHLRPLMRLLLHFAEHGPWIFGPVHTRLTRLSPHDGRRALERMATSPIYFRRVAFLSLRTLLTMGYLAHPKVAEAMGMRAERAPFEPTGSHPAGERDVELEAPELEPDVEREPARDEASRPLGEARAPRLAAPALRPMLGVTS
jgi:hypothetical protein